MITVIRCIYIYLSIVVDRMVNICQDVMINVKQRSMYVNQFTTLIRTSETCFAFAGEIIVLTGNNNDDGNDGDDDDNNYDDNNYDDNDDGDDGGGGGGGGGITDGVECR
jgi:hypothetical protein